MSSLDAFHKNFTNKALVVKTNDNVFNPYQHFGQVRKLWNVRSNFVFIAQCISQSANNKNTSNPTEAVNSKVINKYIK